MPFEPCRDGHDPVWSPSLRRYVCDFCGEHMPDPDLAPDPTGRQARGANRRAVEETGRYLGERRDV